MSKRRAIILSVTVEGFSQAENSPPLRRNPRLGLQTPRAVIEPTAKPRSNPDRDDPEAHKAWFPMS